MLKTQKMIFLDTTQDRKGHPKLITYERFKEECEKESISDTSQIVFLFSGNDSHHTIDNTLYSERKGTGLAAVAESLRKHKVPTLSLPARFNIKKNQLRHKNGAENQRILAENAIRDIWYAIGYGLNLA